MLGKKVGIDLGTTSVRLFVKGEGPVLTEPAAVAVAGGEPLAYGTAALEAASQHTGVELRTPFRDGAMADPATLDALLQHLINRSVGRQRIFKPDVMVAVPAALGGDERRAILDIVVRAGARTAYLIDAPMAAAIGAGLPLSGSRGHLAIDAGGGITEIAVLALESTVVVRSLPGGGARLTKAIADHVEHAHGVTIDHVTAEQAKCELASATGFHEERTLAVHGTDRSGEPAALSLSSTAVAAAIAPHLHDLAVEVRSVVEQTPQGLVGGIREEGAMLMGGGALLRGLDRYLAAIAGVSVRVAADPAGCVLRGTGAALENLDLVKRHFLYIR